MTVVYLTEYLANFSFLNIEQRNYENMKNTRTSQNKIICILCNYLNVCDVILIHFLLNRYIVDFASLYLVV